MADFNALTSMSASSAVIPDLPALSLSEAEAAQIRRLASRALSERSVLLSTQVYYLAQQEITNLKIAIPEELALKLRTLVGWAAIAVDPYVERLSVEGFRLPGETDVNQDLADLWDGNGLAAEQSLAFTDTLSMSRSYWTVGSGPEKGDLPRICVESPLNITVGWDMTGRRPMSALQSYTVDSRQHAALYTPEPVSYTHLAAALLRAVLLRFSVCRIQVVRFPLPPRRRHGPGSCSEVA